MQLDNLSDNSDVGRCGFNCSILIPQIQYFFNYLVSGLVWHKNGSKIKVGDNC